MKALPSLRSKTFIDWLFFSTQAYLYIKMSYRARQSAANAAVRNSRIENVSFAKPASASSLLDLSVVVFVVFHSKRLLFVLDQLHRGIHVKIAW